MLAEIWYSRESEVEDRVAAFKKASVKRMAPLDDKSRSCFCHLDNVTFIILES